jgi:hypothetical protein
MPAVLHPARARRAFGANPAGNPPKPAFIPPRQPQPKPVPAASFSFLFLLIVLVREIPEHLTKEKDKEERERPEIVAKWYEVDR